MTIPLVYPNLTYHNGIILSEPISNHCSIDPTAIGAPSGERKNRKAFIKFHFLTVNRLSCISEEPFIRNVNRLTRTSEYGTVGSECGLTVVSTYLASLFLNLLY